MDDMQAIPPSFGRAIDLSALRARAKTPPAAGAASSSGNADSGVVFDVTEANFANEVIQRSSTVPVVLDFWAEWCEPCKQLSPVLEELASEDAGAWILGKIDIERNKQLAAAFGVQSIPMVAAIIGGQPVDAFAGVVPKPQLRQWLDAMLSTAAQAGLTSRRSVQEPQRAEQLVAAAEHETAGDFAAARVALNELLTSDPGNAEASVALARVELKARVADVDATAVIATADAAPTDVDAALHAAEVEAAAGEHERAYARLIEIVRRSTGEDREKARGCLLTLFTIVSPADERVRRARRSLANALF